MTFVLLPDEPRAASVQKARSHYEERCSELEGQAFDREEAERPSPTEVDRLMGRALRVEHVRVAAQARCNAWSDDVVLALGAQREQSVSFAGDGLRFALYLALAQKWPFSTARSEWPAGATVRTCDLWGSELQRYADLMSNTPHLVWDAGAAAAMKRDWGFDVASIGKPADLVPTTPSSTGYRYFDLRQLVGRALDAARPLHCVFLGP